MLSELIIADVLSVALENVTDTVTGLPILDPIVAQYSLHWQLLGAVGM